MTPPRGLVAIIDDDEGVRDSLTILLLSMGYAARAYESAEAFLASKSEDLACLIIDQVMPGMTGLELAGQLRREGSAVPIALISGWITAALASNAAQLSAMTITKPIDAALLLHFIENSVGETQSRYALRDVD